MASVVVGWRYHLQAHLCVKGTCCGFYREFLAGFFDTVEGVQQSASAERRELEPRLDVACVRHAAVVEQLESLEGTLDPDEVENMRRAHMVREVQHPPWEPSWG